MKTGSSRRWFLALAAGVLGVNAGCDLGALMYFLAPDNTAKAKLYQLPVEDKKKAPRVVILTYMGLETRREFIHADRQMAERLVSHVQQLAESNSEHISFVSLRQVEEFRTATPTGARWTWRRSAGSSRPTG